MAKTFKRLIKDDLYNLLDVELINEVPPKENMPVTWSWRSLRSFSFVIRETRKS